MSKQELVEAYVAGHLSRREFVRRLTMLGVSVGAALAYAGSLRTDAYAKTYGYRHERTHYGIQNELSEELHGDHYGVENELGEELHQRRHHP